MKRDKIQVGIVKTITQLIVNAIPRIVADEYPTYSTLKSINPISRFHIDTDLPNIWSEIRFWDGGEWAAEVQCLPSYKLIISVNRSYYAFTQGLIEYLLYEIPNSYTEIDTNREVVLVQAFETEEMIKKFVNNIDFIVELI